jgi:NAD(P)-dependent dehydrogenase (short-subunit alcohol dehydrogenase family)
MATNASPGPLTDRVAVVTGAAAGIGAAIATALATAGATVVAVDRDGERAALTAEACGPAALSRTAGVSREHDVAQAMAGVMRQAGRIDILVNAAGVLGETASFVDVFGSEWNRIFAISMAGAFLCLKEAAAHTVAGGGGVCVVKVASIAAEEGRVDFAPYAARKAAVLSLTRSSAVQRASHQIRVNALCPAAVDTEFWDRIEGIKQKQGAEPGATRAVRAAAIPLGRFAQPTRVRTSRTCSAAQRRHIRRRGRETLADPAHQHGRGPRDTCLGHAGRS